jgi:superfamily II helicase
MVGQYFGLIKNGDKVLLLTKNESSTPEDLINNLEKKYGICADPVPQDVVDYLQKVRALD